MSTPAESPNDTQLAIQAADGTSTSTPSRLPTSPVPLTNHPVIILEIFDDMLLSDYASAVRCNYTMWSLLAPILYQNVYIESAETTPKWTTECEHPQRLRKMRLDFIQELTINFRVGNFRITSLLPPLSGLEWIEYRHLNHACLESLAMMAALRPSRGLAIQDRYDFFFDLVPLPDSISILCIDLTEDTFWDAREYGQGTKQLLDEIFAGKMTRISASFRIWLSRLPTSLTKVYFTYERDSRSPIEKDILINFADGDNKRLRGMVSFDPFTVLDLDTLDLSYDDFTDLRDTKAQGSAEKPFVVKRYAHRF